MSFPSATRRRREADLVGCALAEIGRGASWVKVIADFPDLAAGTSAEATYRIEAIARLVTTVHDVGARVAVHSTVADAGKLVAAGVDSIEHGFGLDEHAIRDMADRGTAWTPTVGAPRLPPTSSPIITTRARIRASWRIRQPSWRVAPGCGEQHAQAILTAPA